MRSAGSREALNTCMSLLGTEELLGITTPWFPLQVVPMKQEPAATGGVAAVLYGVNNTAPA